MKKLFSLFILLCAVHFSGIGKTKPVVVSKFRKQLTTITRVAGRPSGFDSLKHTELVSGVWTVRTELDGFLPTIIYDEFHPAGRLLMKAESVTPAALQHVRMLTLKGLPGYKMVDSDMDKTIEIDRTTESRKVIFTRKERFTETVITVIYNAHSYSSVTMLIESIRFPAAS
jgi:hypothetical protein